MTFHGIFNSIFNKSKAANSEIVTVELKRHCFPFAPDLYQVPRSQVQVQVPITPDQVQLKYWSPSEW